MESPAIWNRLTAGIAVAGHHDPGVVWQFLVAEGLVQDTPAGRREFDAVYQSLNRLDITGPSVAMRVAARIAHLAVQPAATVPDPFGAFTLTRFAGFVRSLPPDHQRRFAERRRQLEGLRDGIRREPEDPA